MVLSNSITSPTYITGQNADDLDTPFTFFKYLDKTNAFFSPDEYNQKYIQYVLDWNTVKGNAYDDAVAYTREVYTAFLRELTLNFTTKEEQAFLTNADISSPLNADILLPFYANKIKDICLAVKNQRDKSKFKIEENKRRGTVNGVEQYIYDTIIDYVFNISDTRNIFSTYTALSTFASELKIDIEDYVDTFSNYYNIDGSDASLLPERETRDVFFTANYNTYNTDTIFSGSILLPNGKKSIVNMSKIIDINFFLDSTRKLLPIYLNKEKLDLCAPDKEITTAVEAATTEITPSRDKLLLSMFSKYIGVDIHYIQTNEQNVPTSGILVRAAADYKNILNVDNSSIAAIPSTTSLTPLKKIGKFFKPDKIGVLTLTNDKKSLVIDTSKLVKNKLYAYPDPAVYSNVSGENAYPYITILDNASVSRQYGSSYAYTLPSPTSVFSGYVSLKSKEQRNNSFAEIYDRGLITTWKTDIFGNEYGVLKNFNNSFNRNYATENYKYVKCLNLHGGFFRFPTEGYSFNYATDTGTITVNNIEYIRTGLSAVPSEAISTGFSTITSGDTYSLYMREFLPYQTCSTQYLTSYDSGIITTREYDIVYSGGGFIGIGETGYYELEESFTPTLCDGTEDMYAEILLQGSIHSLSGIMRSTVPDRPADFTLSFASLLTAGDAITVNGGSFINNVLRIPQTEYSPLVGNTVLSPSAYSGDTVSIYNQHIYNGQVFVRSKSTYIQPLSVAFEDVLDKFTTVVSNELYTNVYRLDVIYDTLVLYTSSYFVLEKIKFDGVNFLQPNTSNVYLRYSTDNFDKVSNTFYDSARNMLYYYKTSCIEIDNNQYINFDVYEYNIDKHEHRVVYANSMYPATSGMFTVTESISTKFISIDSYPELTYNSANDKYKFVVMLKDQNKLSYILCCTTKYTGRLMEIEAVDFYENTNFNNTTSFVNSNITQYSHITAFNVYGSSAVINTTNQELII